MSVRPKSLKNIAQETLRLLDEGGFHAVDGRWVDLADAQRSAVAGHRTLLLGGWGCGVFRNDPALVADAFGVLLSSDRFSGAFDHVTFAVFDRTKLVHPVFESRFG